MAVLNNLNPERVFYHFEEICKIPHASYNTGKIAEYLVNFAKEHGLEYTKDDSDNVIIRKKAAPGYEEAEGVILQGHTDMVAAVAEGAQHDFDNDGLKLAIDGDWLYAENTTLGADNGIAVAYALAILEDETLAHPALEVLLTTNEEVGLLGADAVDMSMIKGKYLINMDSETEGILLAGCAGGLNVTCKIPVGYVEASGTRYQIKISGLAGGHSGAEIHQPRANANKLMGRLLFTLEESVPFYLAELSGGDRNNIIANHAEALILADSEDEETMNTVLDALRNAVKNEYAGSDEDIKITVTKLDAGTEPVLNPVSKGKVIFFLMNQPHGVIKMSGTVENIVETSTNAAIMSLTPEAFVAIASVRSSIESAKYTTRDQICYLAEFLGGECTQDGEYPAWEFRTSSKLRDIMCNTWKEMYDSEVQVTTIHAGLECGLFTGKKPELDCISLGPDMKDIHSPKERLSISSTKRTWEYILEVLKNMK